MVCDGILMIDGWPDPVPNGFGKFSLMKNVQKFFGLGRRQIEAVATNKIQSIPWSRVVPGGNANSSIGREPRDSRLQTGCRTNAKIDNVTTGGQQTCHNRSEEHTSELQSHSF